MARADNRYSRFVMLAKVAFPLLALGLLSTLFLFNRTIDPGDAIPMAEGNVEEIAREQRLSAPQFSGITSDGSAISVVAESAIPDPNNPRRMTIKNAAATLKTNSAVTYELTSQQAVYDGETETLTLEGDVVITNSDGYRLRSDLMISRLDEISLQSPGPVDGFGPFGTIEAGSMALTTDADGQVLVFKDRVKLVYGLNK